jgi:hypothetical protein
MSVTIELHEQRALVKMLMHEHFTYGDEGIAAASALKKIAAAAEAGQELMFVGGEEDALKDIKAMKDDAHQRALRLSNVIATISGSESVAVCEEIGRAMMSAYVRGRSREATETKQVADLIVRLREHGCPTYLCRDGSRTRDGALLCVYCDGTTESHADDCVWPALLRLAE